MSDVENTKEDKKTIKKNGDRPLKIFGKILSGVRTTVVVLFCVVILIFCFNITFKDAKTEYLVGDCVKVKEIDKPVMIIGYYQKNTSTEEIYDYVGVLLPDGFLGEGYNFAFNDEDIMSYDGKVDRQELTEYKANLRNWFNEKSEVVEGNESK